MVVYWGRKGGGLQLFEEFVKTADINNLIFKVSRRPTKQKSKSQEEPISTFDVLGWMMARKKLIQIALSSNSNRVVFVMASPWDIFLGARLKRKGIEVVRVIHDATPHPGDFFPSRLWISWLLRDSSRIVVLSRFVGNQLIDIYGVEPSKITTTLIPYPRIVSKTREKLDLECKVLLIGRGKKYQGQDLMEKAWPLLKMPNTQLVIAGQGFKRNRKTKGITYKIGWLSNGDLLREISSSSVVVLPYTEASQSGTIPICTAFGIPVIVTPVGGLPEQVIEGKTGLVIPDLTPEALALGIRKILSNNFDVPALDPEKSQWELVCKSIGINVDK